MGRLKRKRPSALSRKTLRAYTRFLRLVPHLPQRKSAAAKLFPTHGTGHKELLCRNSTPLRSGSIEGTVPHLFGTAPAEGLTPPLRRWRLLPGFAGFRPPSGYSSTARLYLFVEVYKEYSMDL